MAQGAVIFLTIMMFVGFVKGYLDWSGFKKTVHLKEFVDKSLVKKTALKIALSSAVMGLSVGLVGLVVQRSTHPSSAESPGIMLYLASVLSCIIGWVVMGLLIFVVGVMQLISRYKDNSLK